MAWRFQWRGLQPAGFSSCKVELCRNELPQAESPLHWKAWHRQTVDKKQGFTLMQVWQPAIQLFPFVSIRQHQSGIDRATFSGRRKGGHHPLANNKRSGTHSRPLHSWIAEADLNSKDSTAACPLNCHAENAPVDKSSVRPETVTNTRSSREPREPVQCRYPENLFVHNDRFAQPTCSVPALRRKS